MERAKEFARSFKHALGGLMYALKNEKNFQNELIVAAMVILAMVYFKVTGNEAVVLLLVIAIVLVLELFNTAMERVMDILKPKIHPYAKLIKDLMAASVLLMSLLTIAIGIIIFLPYIALKLQNWGLF